jgi:hypothetical protein
MLGGVAWIAAATATTSGQNTFHVPEYARNLMVT